MSTITAFSQRDPRWQQEQLGFCPRITIGKAGCLVTSVSAMLATWGIPTDPARLNAWLKISNGYVSGCNYVYRAIEPYGVKLRGVLKPPYGEKAGELIQWAFYETSSAAIIILVDSDHTEPGLQSHYVRMLPPEDNSWPIIDPWQLPGQEFIDLRRYLYGADPTEGVKQIIVYEHVGGQRWNLNVDQEMYQQSLYPLQEPEQDATIVEIEHG